MRFVSLSLAGAALALTGCATGSQGPEGPHKMATPFDARAAANQNKDGKGVVNGSAYVVREGGLVTNCVGGPVVMLPATAYATERIQFIYGRAPEVGEVLSRDGAAAAQQQISFDPEPVEYRQHQRSATCDEKGLFQFKRVKDGDYYVFGLISWQSQPFEGRLLITRIAVRNERTPAVMLTPPTKFGP